MRLIEVGSDGIRSTALARMSATLAPGKQCVTALKNRISRVVESPIIIVVGGKSGRGVGGREWPVVGTKQPVLDSDGQGKEAEYCLPSSFGVGDCF